MTKFIVSIIIIVLVVGLSWTAHPEDPYSYASFLMGCAILGIVNTKN
jgi:hypothetical protein